MFNKIKTVLASLVILSVDGFEVSLVNNGPVIIGGTINFWAEVRGSYNYKTFRYKWEDDAVEGRHLQTYKIDSPKGEWNITYDQKGYTPGDYEVQVEICAQILSLNWPCTSRRTSFSITGDLNGAIILVQNNRVRESSFVSNHTEVQHNVSLKETDLAFLEDDVYDIQTYWFLDCAYLGMTRNLTFRHNYTKADVDCIIQAIVIAEKPGNITDVQVINSTSNVTGNGFSDVLQFLPFHDDFCNNSRVPSSIIPREPNKLYGFYEHEVKPRRPVQVLNIDGNNWLKNGDLLNLTLTFTGSPPYSHCIQFKVGEHNVTGNETCTNYFSLSSTKINVIHYYGFGDKHTVIFIIKNAVSRSVTAVVVTNYIAKKHAQLSVIIVPISCSAIAVILIVFGVAFYIQSKKRYTVEVADFDFSTNNDMEYKSFKERLREAASSAFTRVKEEDSEEVPHWSPSRKYGSMQ